MNKLKLTKINQYRTSKGVLMNTYRVTGSKEAVAQYVADQSAVVRKNGQTGASFEIEGDPTSAPLYWSQDLGEEISRGKQGGWFINDELQDVLMSQAQRERARGNDAVADAMISAIVAEKVAKAKAMLAFRSTPAPVTSPVGDSAELGTV
jgi:hypothetical protein